MRYAIQRSLTARAVGDRYPDRFELPFASVSPLFPIGGSFVRRSVPNRPIDVTDWLPPIFSALRKEDRVHRELLGFLHLTCDLPRILERQLVLASFRMGILSVLELRREQVQAIEREQQERAARLAEARKFVSDGEWDLECQMYGTPKVPAPPAERQSIVQPVGIATIADLQRARRGSPVPQDRSQKQPPKTAREAAGSRDAAIRQAQRAGSLARRAHARSSATIPDEGAEKKTSPAIIGMNHRGPDREAKKKRTRRTLTERPLDVQKLIDEMLAAILRDKRIVHESVLDASLHMFCPAVPQQTVRAFLRVTLAELATDEAASSKPVAKKAIHRAMGQVLGGLRQYMRSARDITDEDDVRVWASGYTHPLCVSVIGTTVGSAILVISIEGSKSSMHRILALWTREEFAQYLSSGTYPSSDPSQARSA